MGKPACCRAVPALCGAQRHRKQSHLASQFVVSSRAPYSPPAAPPVAPAAELSHSVGGARGAPACFIANMDMSCTSAVSIIDRVLLVPAAGPVALSAAPSPTSEAKRRRFSRQLGHSRPCPHQVRFVGSCLPHHWSLSIYLGGQLDPAHGCMHLQAKRKCGAAQTAEAACRRAGQG